MASHWIRIKSNSLQRLTNSHLSCSCLFYHVMPHHSSLLSVDLGTPSFFLFLEYAKFIPAWDGTSCFLCLKHWIHEHLPSCYSVSLSSMSFSSTAVSYPQANLLFPLNSPVHPCVLFVTALIAFSNDTSYALTCLLSMYPLHSASSMIVGECLCCLLLHLYCLQWCPGHSQVLSTHLNKWFVKIKNIDIENGQTWGLKWSPLYS